MLFHPRQLSDFWRDKQPLEKLENLLERERDQLPLWVRVALGCGIASWYVLANSAWSLAFISLCAGLGLFAAMTGRERRAGKALFWFALLAAIGCALIWFRSWSAAAPVLERPVVTFSMPRLSGSSRFWRVIWSG
jgi:competence protein ComEC